MRLGILKPVDGAAPTYYLGPTAIERLAAACRREWENAPDDCDWMFSTKFLEAYGLPTRKNGLVVALQHHWSGFRGEVYIV